jgi:CHAT domain-containing protein
MRQHGLHDVSPEEPSYAAVMRLLQQGGYSWLHVAAHGNFYAEDPDGESAIWLMDQQPLTPRSIVGEVEYYLREQRPAFVFNACESGHQGWAITGLGGWAGRLIGAGAGLFLAPLWVVNDAPAFKFSTTVYQALLDGKTAAEAVRQGRITARSLGNPTWLAYSLYAHPNARVIQ